MVYSAPSPVTTTAISSAASEPSSSPVLGARPAHRRQRSHNISAEPQGPGAFASMGSLPRRRSSRKAFFLEDESPSPEPEEEDQASPLSPLTINTNVRTFSPMPAPPPQSVPFPRTSSEPLSPMGGPGSRPSYSPRPSFSRTPSSPMILLSNGKPLKPSLKSSASAPHIPDELRVHSRAKSEPSTPSIKSVHFRDEDEIEEVRVYNRTGRPANLLLKPGEETETETEVESAFPFPRTLGGMGPSSPMTPPAADVLHFEIDPASGATSTVPRPNPDLYSNIHLESISLPKTRPASIRGSVLVRNVTFEKHVALRFTFDEWQTTSEVFCKHVVSLPGLPPPFPRAQTVGDAVGQIAQQSQGPSEDSPAWDRFSFQIRLEDYATRLDEKTLWLVARYTAPGVGEWWDNNMQANYRIGFRKSSVPPTIPEAKNNVRQQGTFVAPSTLRLTPQSGSPLTLYSTPAAAVLDATVPGLFSSSPRPSPGASPRHSPNASPNASTTDVRNHARSKPKMGLGLGIGVNGSSRPPQLSRSMSSPPVFTPSVGPGSGGYISQAPPATRGAPPSRQQVDGNLSPLMARLSRLSLSNYSAPSRPVVVSAAERQEDEKSGPSSPVDKKIVGGQFATQFTPSDAGAPVPALQVTASTPPATEKHTVVGAETPKATTPPLDEPTATRSQESSPLGSRSGSAETLMPGSLPIDDPLSTSPVTTSSTSTSATSSPLLATPSQSSLTDIPALASGPPASMWNEPFKRSSPPPKSSGQDGSGSGSDSSSSTSKTKRRIVSPKPVASRATFSLGYPPAPLNLPRADPSMPFSPASTPRYSLDAALMTSGAGRDSPSRSRVSAPGGADYAALVREWCFARSPSPTPVGTPQEEHVPVHVRVQATVAVPRGESPNRRDTPRGSPRPSPPVNATGGWLGIGDGYGFAMPLGERRSGWEAGKA